MMRVRIRISVSVRVRVRVRVRVDALTDLRILFLEDHEVSMLSEKGGGDSAEACHTW